MNNNDLDGLLTKLNPLVCYNSKIKMINRMMTALYDTQFKPYGINGNQFTLLSFIGKAKSTNQKTMANYLRINYSTISRDLDKLENAELIVLNKGADARNSNIVLSTKGMNVLNDVLPVWQKLNGQLHKTFGKELTGQLDHMLNSLKKKE